VPNGVGFSLARNRRSAKRPSEPPAEAASTRKRAQWKEDAKPRRGKIDVGFGGMLGKSREAWEETLWFVGRTCAVFCEFRVLDDTVETVQNNAG